MKARVVVLALCSCPLLGASARTWEDPAKLLVPRPRLVERGDPRPLRGDLPVRVVRGVVTNAPAEVADQAYVLDIREDGVTITASAPAGERYARVTLEQLKRLARAKPSLPRVRIVDWPDLRWRGYMNDCGRNFLEVPAVKAILDVMALYKYNLFHWHLSDYHGWRLESKKYPQLQRKEAFLRQVGRYYTQEEFKEVVRYAAARGITVMPELDVPGHSLALRRGLGVDSMDAPGVGRVVSDLFEELCSLAPADVMPFVHMGTDEVRTKPEVCDDAWPTKWAKTINACGRKAVVWAPGKKIDPSCDVIDMAWYDDHVTNAVNPVFESARVYNTAWDPFDVLTHAAFTKMNRRAGAKAPVLGAITCTWHDDNVGDDTTKLFRECMVFPVIVAMGDNFWSGRETDEPRFQGRMPPGDDPLFLRARDLETRILAQRDEVLEDFKWPFPFVRQTDQSWRLTDFETGRVLARNVAQGALRLWREDLLDGQAFVTNRAGHVVAETWIWSPQDVSCGAWIDFLGVNGVYHRLWQEKMPERGTWDNLGSSVWLNGKRLPPPEWKRPGLRSTTPNVKEQDVPYTTDLLETPMIDEMPTLRAPYPIRLKAGWNYVRLDLPKAAERPEQIWYGLFLPILGTSEHPREVPGLRYSAWPPVSDDW